MMETVRCFDRDIPLLGCWEAVVVGGGSAGASAGIACAQAGLSTLIVEKSLCLGGASVTRPGLPDPGRCAGGDGVVYP